jgi:hypothetical protein
LLALPLVYNRAFFWGFVNFQLALGMFLLALAILVRPRGGLARELALAALCTAIVFTHPYGLLMLAGYLALWLLLGERRELARRALALSPLGLGALAWGLRAGQGAGPLRFGFTPLLERLDDFEESVLGGYRDTSEAGLLLGFFAVFAALAAPVLPLSRARWRALAFHERLLWLFAGANLLLFAVVPGNTSLVGELHVRHALLAAAVLPALVAPPSGARLRAGAGALVLLGLASVAIAWTNLTRFDREARGFDAVIERVPFGARTLMLDWDPSGAVMRTGPYWHFAAYVQARRGGLVAETFPRMFWNLPVRLREDAGVPPTPRQLFIRPDRFDAEGFGAFYDHIVVRLGGDAAQGHFAEPGYRLVFEAPPWQLWRRQP